MKPASHTQDRWARVTELLDGASQRADHRERERYLRQECGDDMELLQEVERLLKFEDASDGLLGEPWLPRVEGAAVDSDADGEGTTRPASQATTQPWPGPPQRWASVLTPGQKVGPYRIERILGRGGMGVVALARDGRLGRQVALKVMWRDPQSALQRQRFDTERRVLARLDHPAIAQIFGSGTFTPESGESSETLPYFTMEYVQGVPIDRHCDDRCLGIDDRLRLLLQVCDALDAAHRNLVVHRDLKPGNILVTEAGQPKVLDFGIAKELDAAQGEAASGLTGTGVAPFTLLGASPEQVRGLPVGVASDVYALGLLLYRLLCGHPPYVLDGDVYENIQRVCDEVPPPPSTRATLKLQVWEGGSPREVLPQVLAEARGMQPQTLRRRLKGDLDAIVARALAKSPEDRYRTVAALADDLERHLDGRPVEARAGGWSYRFLKALKRRRRGIAAAALLGAATVAGVTAWWGAKQQAANETAQRLQADAEAEQAERQSQALTSFARNLVLAADPDVSGGGMLTAEQILRQGELAARRDLGDDRESQAHQLEALGFAYHGLGKLEPARRLFEDALELRQQVYAEDHRLVARGLNNLASVAHEEGNLTDAEELYRSALAMKERLGQDADDRSRVENNLASILMARGALGDAEAIYRRQLDVRRSLPEPNPEEIAASLRSLGNVLFLRGAFTEAERHLREALALRQDLHGEDSVRTAAVWSSLGRVLHAQERLEDAEAVLTNVLDVRERLLGDDHLHVALTRKDVASLYFDQGRIAEAETLWTQAMHVLRAVKPDDAWELADADSQEGARLLAAGRAEEAEPLLRRGYEVLRQVRGEEAIYTRRAKARWEALQSPHP